MLVNYGGVVTQSVQSKSVAPLTDSSKTEKEPEFLKDAADTVAIDTLLNGWQKADKNEDGVASRQELATAAYSLLTQKDVSDEDKGVGRILATLAMGGKEGTGLSELYSDRDGGISRQEIKSLAARDGMSGQMSVDDLKSALGSRYVAGGKDIDLEKLKALGNQDPTKPPSKDPPVEEPAGDVDTEMAGTLLEIMRLFLQILNQYLGNAPISPLQQQARTPLPSQTAVPRLTGAAPLQQSLPLTGAAPLQQPLSLTGASPFQQSLLASPTSPLQRSPLQQPGFPTVSQPLGLQQPVGTLSTGFARDLMTTPFTNGLANPTNTLPSPISNQNFTGSLLNLMSGIVQLGTQALNFTGR